MTRAATPSERAASRAASASDLSLGSQAELLQPPGGSADSLAVSAGGGKDDVVSPRLMKLRYAGRCAICSSELAAGLKAQYDPTSRLITCVDCVTRDQIASGTAIAPDTGLAGASAQREFDRRRAKREARIRSAHPKLGGLILSLTNEPQSTRAFKIGGAGETKLGRHFDRLATAGEIVALHDRKIIKPRGQIDHVVIGPAAVYVVDAKNYTGRVHVRSAGPFGLGERQLYVGQRDCSRLADAMAKQTTAVREALAGLPEAEGVRITPVLSFVDADWSLLFPPDAFRGVRVEGESVVKLVRAPGELDAKRRMLLGHRLAARLPSA